MNYRPIDPFFWADVNDIHREKLQEQFHIQKFVKVEAANASNQCLYRQSKSYNSIVLQIIASFDKGYGKMWIGFGLNKGKCLFEDVSI